MASIITFMVLCLICFILAIVNMGSSIFFNWLTLAVLNLGFGLLIMQIRNTSIFIVENLLSNLISAIYEIYKLLLAEPSKENEQDISNKDS